jgi:hypothetical protein
MQLGAVQGYLNPIENPVKQLLTAIFRELLRNVRVGKPIDQKPSENLPGVFYAATTASVANTEFSIRHQFGTAPYLAIPLLNLTKAGGRVVDLTVTKPADGTRVYLKSSVTSAPVVLYLEA